MSTLPTAISNEDEIQAPQRPPSPPFYVTFAARGLHAQNFPAHKPRDLRIPSPQAMTHVAWSCDGKRLAAVGIDKITRVWAPETSMEYRAATHFSGGHSDDADYVSWNPTHPELFCTSGQKDRRIVFWDARQSRHVQQVQLKVSPVQTNYAPDGKSLLYTSAGHQLFFLTCGKDSESSKDMWQISNKDGTIVASTAMFNHVGDGVILTHHSEHALRIMDYPSLTLRESPAAHVGGCVAVALDPRGRYLASGGYDSIVNIFDLNEWLCARTISSCDNAINALSFSFDGEYLAIASTGSYIDICATETAIPLHRVPALAPSPTVTWHPSKYVFAYCGQTKQREGSPPPVAVISLFGGGI
ncbi:WD40-repeat-containing domain protein [Boletus edulis]|uniref:WD40-repeat-containing domain protein n=1 Tax=Boletus edulis BED1 TaxID=1328754 RepID=A0AAD4GD33_BOLED|nr:WD40-repeat-containing domain protein [Boletus edulis]KAF8437261.1 WD40-repeat-containing domain protein [Boletus edulis BED1]